MHALITGASAGIGEALAREFYGAGYDVTLVARRREKLEALAKELGPKARVLVQDLSDPSRCGELLAAAGPVDVLVCNAGVQIVADLASADPEGAKVTMGTNLLTPMELIRLALPEMLKRGSGAIVGVASLAAVSPPPAMTWYAASKAGFAAFCETLRAEVAHQGVHVVTVYPGPVKTEMADAAYDKLGGRKGLTGMLPEGSAAGLARSVRAAVEKKRARVLYPRFYWSSWFFPRISTWATQTFAPRLPALPPK
jgi:short-subunit dehydrogenase